MLWLLTVIWGVNQPVEELCLSLSPALQANKSLKIIKNTTGCQGFRMRKGVELVRGKVFPRAVKLDGAINCVYVILGIYHKLLELSVQRL